MLPVDIVWYFLFYYIFLWKQNLCIFWFRHTLCSCHYYWMTWLFPELLIKCFCLYFFRMCCLVHSTTNYTSQPFNILMTRVIFSPTWKLCTTNFLNPYFSTPMIMYILFAFLFIANEIWKFVLHELHYHLSSKLFYSRE